MKIFIPVSFANYVCLISVGQEPETIRHDDDIVITPFNMREELEEDGHFDASGTFIFKKVRYIHLISPLEYKI